VGSHDVTLSFDAVVLAGGRGSRLGGTDKAAIPLRGARLVDRVSSAAKRAGAGRIVVVGPGHTAAPGCIAVREDPPGSGPLAAVAAALPSIDAAWTMLLPCDLRHPDAVCRALLEALPEILPSGLALGAEPLDGMLLRDEHGRRQWLAGLYSSEALRRGALALGDDLAGRPLRLIFEGARLREVEVSDGLAADIDTPVDLAQAIAEDLG
jgi:molybdopterin-guanine dinucleotide biosynthesis protein A